MKKAVISFYLILTSVIITGQESDTLRYLDSLLVREEYRLVIDTCTRILHTDSLNPALCYRLGLAWQNIPEEKKAVGFFRLAHSLDTANVVYSYRLARSYFADEKMKLAEPMFRRLLSQDTLNWQYAFYLTNIYMQAGRYDSALPIYQRFLATDSLNCTYLDKTAFALLRKGDFTGSLYLFSKSLDINKNNTSALKNLSYLYASTSRWDTAVTLLGRGMKIDPADMDLYDRRAQLYFMRNYTKRAMDDYLLILASGDTSKLYLKRVGIGYSYNLQPGRAIPYLLLAHKSDTTDYETCSYLGQCYLKIGDSKTSAAFYKKAVKILQPLYVQLGNTYFQCGLSQYEADYNADAIESYKNAYNINSMPGMLLMIANIYDDKLSDKVNALKYYRLFFEKTSKDKMPYSPDYIEKVRNRFEYLEKQAKL